MNQEAVEAIWRAVRAIPRGEVATYGAVAKRAGLPGRARLVGQALKIAPAKLEAAVAPGAGLGRAHRIPRIARGSSPSSAAACGPKASC